MEVHGDIVGNIAMFDFLAAMPAKQVDERGIGAVVVPGAVQREVTEDRGVVLDGGDQPQPVTQVVEPALRVGGRRRGQHMGEDVLHLIQHGRWVYASGHDEVAQNVLVDVCVGGFLADEAAHVVGQFRILHQGQRLVQGGNDPTFGRRKDNVEQTHHV